MGFLNLLIYLFIYLFSEKSEEIISFKNRMKNAVVYASSGILDFSMNPVVSPLLSLN